VKRLTMAGLCAGAGGLEMAVNQVTGAVPLWLAENSADASVVLAERFPRVPNIGDITSVDWSSLPRVDILAAGFPCTDISNAGLRAGITGPKSSVWKNVAKAVSVLRPSLVMLENVAALRGRGLDTVVTDLAFIGYGVRWTTVYASDVKAPHPRRRWFGVAVPLSEHPLPGWDSIRKPMPFTGVFTGGPVRVTQGPQSRSTPLPRLPTPRSRDGKGTGNLERRPIDQDDLLSRVVRTETGSLLKTPTSHMALQWGSGQDPRKRKAGGHGPTLNDEVTHLLPTPCVADGTGGHKTRSGARSGELLLPGVAVNLLPTPKASDGPHGGPSQRDASGHFYLPGVAGHLLPADGSDWSWVCADGRDFGPAVKRWQFALQQGAPCPVMRGRRGGLSLSPAFAEWMMGWPPGHATHTHTPISRSGQLTIIGNGVVPRQAVYAYRFLFGQWREDGGDTL